MCIADELLGSRPTITWHRLATNRSIIIDNHRFAAHGYSTISGPVQYFATHSPNQPEFGLGDYNLNFEKRSPHGWTTLKGLQEQDLSVINSFTQHTINLTRKALRLGSDFVHPVHDDTPDEPDYLSNADVPVEANIALPHSDDWDDRHRPAHHLHRRQSAAGRRYVHLRPVCGPRRTYGR